jgi:antitoxin component YwqK of YwqJK toxin-antitoxin module
MKFSYSLFLVLFSCNQEHKNEYVQQKENTKPTLYISNSAKNLQLINDTVFYNGIKFNGTLFSLNSQSLDTISVENYSNGILNGVVKKWYDNKNLMECREYKNGQKDGKQVAFFENGKIKFEFIAKNDIYEGELREWNKDGNLIHLANYKNGQEEGTQKLWYDNGKIRANYVMINGKRYGLLGTKNCKNVSDSIFNFK